MDANRVLIHWADLYRELLTSVAALASDTTVADTEVRDRLQSLVAEHQVLTRRRRVRSWCATT